MKAIYTAPVAGVLSVIIFVGVFALLPSPVLASGSVSVTPAKIERTFVPGESQVVPVTLENTTSGPLIVHVSLADMGPDAEGTGFTLVKEGEDPPSFATVAQVSSGPIQILTGKRVTIPVTLTIPADADPGGRFGAVVFTFSPVFPGGEEAASVAPTSRLATLFFLRVSGAVHEEGVLQEFGFPDRAVFVPSPSPSSPLLFYVGYRNTGTVHLDPYGRLTISPLLVGPARAIVVDPWAVLPDSTRLREIAVDDPLYPWVYTAHLEMNRGYGNMIDERSFRFIVYPTGSVAVLWGIGILLGLFLVYKSIRLSRHFVR